MDNEHDRIKSQNIDGWHVHGVQLNQFFFSDFCTVSGIFCSVHAHTELRYAYCQQTPSATLRHLDNK